MAGFIKQESIDEVSNKTDIVSVIGEYVQLTQKGNDWWGCCPFHHEKTPSFSVSSDKKFYYCFGCHAKGTVFKFIQEMENCSFSEAVESLAKKSGVQVEYTSTGREEYRKDPSIQLKAEYTDLYTRVANSFHYMLMETEAGKFALEYITARGLTKETLEKFKLGYSPADRTWLKKFLKGKNYSDEFLANSGLFSKRYPDISFFNDRLMFPIFNKNGEVVAMGGRFLRGDPSKSPKYLNSSDLIQYKKGSTLYAFNFAKQAIHENHKVIFCEGYMDCIAYHQCGLTYAVAPLGTALTEEQISLVKNYVRDGCVMLSFDSDGAGLAATKRAIIMCRQHDLTVKVIKLSGGKDPAEIMINYGPEVLTNEVNSAILDNDFLLSVLTATYGKDSPDAKLKAAMEFFTYIDALQTDIQKNACLEQFCRTYEVSLDAIRNDYLNRSQIEQKMKKTLPSDQNVKEEKIKVTAESAAVLSVIDDDISFFKKLRNEITVDDLSDSLAKKIFIILEECSRNDNFSVSSILNHCENPELQNLIIKSLQTDSANKEQSVNESIKLLKRNVLKKQNDELQVQICRLERSQLPEDKAQLMELISRRMEISSRLEDLKKRD
ncbi:DNA primase [Treponema rectale]|uniref:DNA primase n=1 Tax=Treponema rectale TaxID=744512 RepID=A0A840SFU5_9SPIR|nr:DNA primase [Treponema rectale]MBB5218312.1 DNA primase [Treponema rectale]QOS39987.1 DNA primase [Treponema rectale]